MLRPEKKHFCLLFHMTAEIAMLIAVVLVGCLAIYDQSLLEFAVFVIALTVWKYLGYLLPFWPSEIKLYLEDD